MTDEQLRILVAAIIGTIPETLELGRGRLLDLADDLIAFAKQSSPPSLAAVADDPGAALSQESARSAAATGGVLHTDSPDCQCADCVKRDARRWRAYRFEYPTSSVADERHADAFIAAEDARKKSK